MIKSFRHKGLKQLYSKGRTAIIGSVYQASCIEILNALEIAEAAEEMEIAGFDFHALKGNYRGRYAVSVNKNWRITFGWDDGAVQVDLEDYH